jgi:hypothetical protein
MEAYFGILEKVYAYTGLYSEAPDSRFAKKTLLQIKRSTPNFRL